MYNAEAEEQLLGGAPDFVLDAIDNIHTKVRGCNTRHLTGLDPGLLNCRARGSLYYACVKFLSARPPYSFLPLGVPSGSFQVCAFSPWGLVHGGIQVVHW